MRAPSSVEYLCIKVLPSKTIRGDVRSFYSIILKIRTWSSVQDCVTCQCGNMLEAIKFF